MDETQITIPHHQDHRKIIKGGIHIELKQAQFTSNQTIQGNLHINLEEQYQGHVLVISLEGIEQTQFNYKTGTKKQKSIHQAKGIKRFLNYSLPIYDFASDNDSKEQFKMDPGQWSIPFNLQIGDKLPSSISYKHDDNNKCALKYHLCAYIISNNPEYKHIQSHQEIIISQISKTNDDNSNNNLKKLSTNPAQCFCLNKGELNLECSLDQNYYSPGQQIKIQLKLDGNNCPTHVKSVMIDLKGKINMKGEQTTREYNNLLQITNVEQPIMNNYIDQEVILDLPNDMNLTCEGELIDLQYELVLTTIFSNSCITYNTPLNIDVRIYSSNVTEKQENEKYTQLLKSLPNTFENWKPKILEQQKLNEQQQLAIQNIHVDFTKNQKEYLYHSNLEFGDQIA